MLISMQTLLGTLSLATLPTGSRSFWGIATTTPHPWSAFAAAGDYVLPPRDDVPDDWFWWLLRSSALKWRTILTVDSYCTINIHDKNINVGAVLNQYTIIASANPLDRYTDHVVDMYAYCYANMRKHRFRRVRRLAARTYNPRYWHGENGPYIPMHDIAIITTLGPLYRITTPAHHYHRVMKGTVPTPETNLPENITLLTPLYKEKESASTMWILITYTHSYRSVNCGLYMPKWWGKFICLKSDKDELYSGAPLLSPHYAGQTKLFALGSFHWTDGKLKLLVMTDLRHYRDRINAMSDNAEGDYYDYTEIDFGYGHDSGGWYNNYHYDDYWHRAAGRARNQSLPSS